MSAETCWRREWKPNLTCIPWHSLPIDSNLKHLAKFLMASDSYQFLITVKEKMFSEHLSNNEISLRSQVSILSSPSP